MSAQQLAALSQPPTASALCHTSLQASASPPTRTCRQLHHRGRLGSNLGERREGDLVAQHQPLGLDLHAAAVLHPLLIPPPEGPPLLLLEAAATAAAALLLEAATPAAAALVTALLLAPGSAAPRGEAPHLWSLRLLHQWLVHQLESIILRRRRSQRYRQGSR